MSGAEQPRRTTRTPVPKQQHNEAPLTDAANRSSGFKTLTDDVQSQRPARNKKNLSKYATEIEEPTAAAKAGSQTKAPKLLTLQQQQALQEKCNATETRLAAVNKKSEKDKKDSEEALNEAKKTAQAQKDQSSARIFQNTLETCRLQREVQELRSRERPVSSSAVVANQVVPQVKQSTHSAADGPANRSMSFQKSSAGGKASAGGEASAGGGSRAQKKNAESKSAAAGAAGGPKSSQKREASFSEFHEVQEQRKKARHKAEETSSEEAEEEQNSSVEAEEEQQAQPASTSREQSSQTKGRKVAKLKQLVSWEQEMATCRKAPKVSVQHELPSQFLTKRRNKDRRKQKFNTSKSCTVPTTFYQCQSKLFKADVDHLFIVCEDKKYHRNKKRVAKLHKVIGTGKEGEFLLYMHNEFSQTSVVLPAMRAAKYYPSGLYMSDN